MRRTAWAGTRAGHRCDGPSIIVRTFGRMPAADRARSSRPRGGRIPGAAPRPCRRPMSTGAPTIAAPTNPDAHRISESVRHERRKLGQVGPDLMTVRATDGERNYPLALAKGDRVRLFRSTGAQYEKGRGGGIGRNGSVLEVIDATTQGLTLRARTGRTGPGRRRRPRKPSWTSCASHCAAPEPPPPTNKTHPPNECAATPLASHLTSPDNDLMVADARPAGRWEPAELGVHPGRSLPAYIRRPI